MKVGEPMKKVLIVDDDYGYQNVVSIAAKNRGWIPIAVSSWKMVQKEIAQQEYSLIISDYELGNETMLPLLEFIHINDLQIPVIVVSAYDKDNFEDKTINMGAEQCYEKLELNLSKLYRLFDRYND